MPRPQDNVESEAAQAVQDLAAQLSNAMAHATTSGRTSRAEGRVTDDSRHGSTRDSVNALDVGGDEVAQLNALHQQAINAANLKAIADAGAANMLFQQAANAGQQLQTNASATPLGVITTRILSDAADFSAAMRSIQVRAAEDAQLAKQRYALDAVTERDDLAFRGQLRDETQAARGIQRDQDTVAAVLVRSLSSLEPIIIERLRADTEFRAAFITMLVQALQGAGQKQAAAA